LTIHTTDQGISSLASLQTSKASTEASHFRPRFHNHATTSHRARVVWFRSTQVIWQSTRLTQYTFSGNRGDGEGDPFIPSEPVWRTPEWLLEAPFEHNADGSRRLARWGHRSMTERPACHDDVTGVAGHHIASQRYSRIHYRTSHAFAVTALYKRIDKMSHLWHISTFSKNRCTERNMFSGPLLY